MKTILANPSAVVLCVVACNLACALPGLADFDLNTAVGVWHMNEGEGEETKDSSPSGSHGKLWRDPTWVDGRFGKALEFDGQSFVWIKNANGVPEGQSPRTLMCHFKWPEINDFADPINMVSDAEVLLCLGPGKDKQQVSLVISADGGAGGSPGIDTCVDRHYFKWDGDTEWHHLAAVFPEGATHSNHFVFYLDGVLQDEQFVSGLAAKGGVREIASTGGQVMIGALAGNMSNFFKGVVDDAAVFPFAMAAEDIANIASRGLVRGQGLDVSPNGRLATSWGGLKGRY
jgi:hypothetical protein